MKLTEWLQAQLDREAEGTRKALEAVPVDKPDWKPHEKSMPLGGLASLVATMPSWIDMIVNRDELDIATGEGAPSKASSNAELVEMQQKSLESARKALAGTTDEHLTTPWKLKWGEKVLLEQPRNVVIADTIAHLAHHRGQLTVYLRLNDCPVPAIYGASADSGW
ncbi:MAG TPA: DinB family protein [Thermoanaerobaculia bacterium]|nr:DinB family protein [Thermoanaerobaculia bacterium]